MNEPDVTKVSESSPTSIFDLMKKVQEHPDYVYGDGLRGRTQMKLKSKAVA